MKKYFYEKSKFSEFKSNKTYIPKMYGLFEVFIFNFA